ncbi:hypothetical protein P280DRAFT_71615 [Massarina eburnea CBS 473.64]|uniref:Uncharacterized protein n=1 Tax=Massarina eburnea CBS 473.64 TaxID=1395130 RepID=A0A6A6RX00_9PLEO|nr:hypothetical protein P280DRAFT_71615 [Massarina eburnea CBS 473.64]
MSIFSRFRKAKKAAEEHKKAVAAQAEVEPPQSPYRHIPTHAAQDALAATPTTFTHEETREKIAVVRKRKSEMLMREKKYPQRPSIDASARGNISVPLHRVRSDGYMNEIPFRETLQSQAYVEPTGCGRQPRRSHDDYSSYPKEEPHEYFHAFSYPRDVPPPPVTMRPRKYPTASRKSSIANMKKSLLSTMTMEEEPEEYFSSSSRDSGYTTASNRKYSVLQVS